MRSNRNAPHPRSSEADSRSEPLSTQGLNPGRNGASEDVEGTGREGVRGRYGKTGRGGSRQYSSVPGWRFAQALSVFIPPESEVETNPASASTRCAR